MRSFRRERDFQAAVLRLAHMAGWKHYHTLNSRGSPSGWPDLVLVRGGSALFRELKLDKGRLTAAQVEWIEALRGAGLDASVWRPRDWETICAELGYVAKNTPLGVIYDRS